MKKLSAHGRRRLLMRAAHEERKRIVRRQDGGIYGDSVRLGNAEFPALPPRPNHIAGRRVALEGAIDLIDNTDSALVSLSELDRLAVSAFPGPTRVLVDMRQVNAMEPAGLLFLCSRLSNLSARRYVEVTGTYPPKHSAALRMLRDAEFNSFLRGAPIPYDPTARTLSLIDGTSAGSRRVTPQTAARIHSFLNALHPKLTIEELDALSVAVTECLENVRVHAYATKDDRRQGWYVVGRYDDETATSSVAILDMGVGIAATVTDKFFFGARFKSNADILAAATAGRVTATGKPNRGKGYGFLRSFVGKAEGRRLTVLSSSAMVVWGKSGILQKRATDPFTGTIVCLQITNS